jgi:IS30 family transposase
MVRPKLTLAERWQAVGVSLASFSNRRVAGQMGVHHSVIDRLMQRMQATRMVDEGPRSGRLAKLQLERKS